MGILARSESVLALAPPAAPSAVLASLWRGRWSGGAPFCFPFFFLPVFSSPLLVGKFTLCRRKVREYEPPWETILAQVLANLYLTKVGSGLQRVSFEKATYTRPGGPQIRQNQIAYYLEW